MINYYENNPIKWIDSNSLHVKIIKLWHDYEVCRAEKRENVLDSQKP